MRERTLRGMSAGLAGVGAAISAYLLYVAVAGGTLVWATGSWEPVQRSPHAEVLGVPVAALGLAGFLGVLVAALARGGWARLCQATIAISAFLFSGYLLVVQLFVLDAICEWCVAVDLLATAGACLALMRLRFPFPAAPALAPPPSVACPYSRRSTRRSATRVRPQRARAR